MSRDQKPGKIKLVSTAASHPAHHDRFEEDHFASEAHAENPAEDTAHVGRPFIHPLVFLIGCIIGGAGVAVAVRMIG